MKKLKIIDFETHFYTQELVDLLLRRKEYPYYLKEADNYHMMYADNVRANHAKVFVNKLLDIAEGRLAQMNEDGIDIQVLSLSEPSVCWMSDEKHASSIAKNANDILFEHIKKNPTRFKGFAALAPQDPKTAIKELERCVKELGFIGWLTHSNYGVDKYLDDKKYWPILEAAESINAPIYLHPLIPAMTPFHKYGFSSAGAPLGFQFEAALCLIRMILGGVFDAFPKLQIILGHLGETLPFLMERLDFTFVKPWFRKEDRPNLKRLPSEVLRQNVHVTVSGRFYEPALKYVIEAMGEDRVLFASDYPYEMMKEGVEFIKKANIKEEVRDKIFYKNAKFFGI